MKCFINGILVVSVIACMALPFVSFASDSIIVVDVADSLIQQGAQAYYQVYGAWPGTWREVVEAGLVQVPLVSLSGAPVDPDDGAFDGDGDLQYLTAQDGNPPDIARMVDDENETRVVMTKIGAVKSFRERYASSADADVQSALKDEARLKQWAIAGMLFEELNYCSWVYDKQPVTFEEFISAGVTCIDASSINPLTKTAFKGDGSPDDFLFHAKLEKGTGEAVAFSLLATDAAGGTPWKFTF
jgi:hypothetical protein